VVVDLKEEDGLVYVPGVEMAKRVGAYSADIADMQAWLADLKKRGIYTVAGSSSSRTTRPRADTPGSESETRKGSSGGIADIPRGWTPITRRRGDTTF